MPVTVFFKQLMELLIAWEVYEHDALIGMIIDRIIIIILDVRLFHSFQLNSQFIECKNLLSIIQT